MFDGGGVVDVHLGTVQSHRHLGFRRRCALLGEDAVLGCTFDPKLITSASG